MEDYIERPEILKKCKGYTLKITHPNIKKNCEYQIHAFRRLEGKHGEFFMLYCYLPSWDIYQRVFSNNKLTGYLLENMSFWTRYEPLNGDGNIMIWNKEIAEEIMKFYPGEIGHWHGNDFRKVIFDISEI